MTRHPLQAVWVGVFLMTVGMTWMLLLLGVR